jgi:putative transposase
MKRTTLPQRTSATGTISYAGYRFPPDVISYAVWLYYRFPLSLRMVEELLAARGIELTYETVRRWSVKFGLGHCPAYPIHRAGARRQVASR